MCVILAYILLLINVIKVVVVNNKVAGVAFDASKKLTLFLLVILMCWIYPCLYNLYNFPSSVISMIFTSFLPVSQGTLTTIVFYITSAANIKLIWKHYSASVSTLSGALKIAEGNEKLSSKPSSNSIESPAQIITVEMSRFIASVPSHESQQPPLDDVEVQIIAESVNSDQLTDDGKKMIVSPQQDKLDIELLLRTNITTRSSIFAFMTPMFETADIADYQSLGENELFCYADNSSTS